MRGFLVVILTGILLSGCIQTETDDLEPEQHEAGQMLKEGWEYDRTNGQSIDAWYEGGALHAHADNGSVIFGLDFEEEVELDPFRLRIQATFEPDRHINEENFGFSMWDRSTGEPNTWYWVQNHGEYASSGINGENLLVVRDPQDLIIEQEKGGLTLETLDPFTIPEGSWGFLIGGAPFASVRISLDLPENVVKAEEVIPQDGCHIVSHSEFNSSVSLWTITGPVFMVDAEHEFSTPHGLHAFFHDLTLIGMRSMEMVYPNGAVSTSDSLHTDPLGSSGTIMAFEVDEPGNYTARINHAADIALNGLWLTYCTFPPLMHSE